MKNKSTITIVKNVVFAIIFFIIGISLLLTAIIVKDGINLNNSYLFNDKNSFTRKDIKNTILKADILTVPPSYYGIKTDFKENNIIVKDIESNSPAYKSGLLSGDIILKMNNIDINKNKSAFIWLWQEPKLTLTIKRNGEQININLERNTNYLKPNNDDKNIQVVYTNSLGIKNNYAYLWFKIPQNSNSRLIIPAKNGIKYDFDYTKDLYICDCKNHKMALAYSGIYKNNKLYRKLPFYIPKEFQLNTFEPNSLQYVYYDFVCTGHDLKS